MSSVAGPNALSPMFASARRRMSSSFRMIGRGDVWVAPLAEIAAHVRHAIDSGEWTPRIVDVERVEE